MSKFTRVSTIGCYEPGVGPSVSVGLRGEGSGHDFAGPVHLDEAGVEDLIARLRKSIESGKNMKAKMAE